MASVQILGSAAAEGIPAIFCNCRVCREAWKNGGKDVRFRTAYKLSDSVRIDFGPDSMAQEYKFQLHSENLKHLFITHTHEDHSVPDLFVYRQKGFSVVDANNILNVYGNASVINQIQSFFWKRSYLSFNGDFGKFRLKLNQMEDYKPVVLEEDDMEFYPVPANHQNGDYMSCPQFFIFRHGKSWAMIANDTGYFFDEVWQFIEQKKFKFDLVITDCTGGIKDGKDGHMSGKYVIETKERLEKMGSITSSSQFFINHFSHNGLATHAELEAHYNPHGIQVGYDGLVITY